MTLDFASYLSLFEDILAGKYKDHESYGDEKMVHFVKLNASRQKRWLKHIELLPEVVDLLNSIKEEQEWLLITEPWCGDAAHCVPIIYKMSAVNPLVHLNIELRDTDSQIDQYLTNGSRAIPILVISSNSIHDKVVWGPRPVACQNLFEALKRDDRPLEEIKEALQQWYNTNKGEELQKEIYQALKKAIK